MNKKEILLLLVTILVTVGTAVGLIKWLAPGLLGVSRDLQMVQVSKEVPPFFENIFREEDYKSTKFLLNDPYTVMRARPLWPDQFGMGPNDILGFRNRSVPNVADIVTLGDSQTYGNNAILEHNWPSRLRAHISHANPTIYNMSVGAWNGPQYLEMFPKALLFRPRVVVVAFYTGNDPLSAFVQVYGSDHFSDLRLDSSLVKSDAPDKPKAGDDMMPVRFMDGTSTVFTPSYRLVSNQRDDPTVRAGYEILKEIAKRISRLANANNIPLIFTIIPTKELVYEKRIRNEKLPSTSSYDTLTRSERMYLGELAETLKGIPGSQFVDVLSPMENAALTEMLYPSDGNGHPIGVGYDVIARALAPSVGRYLKPQPEGLAVMQSTGRQSVAVLVEKDGYWIFSRNDLIIKNGWRSLAGAAQLSERDLAGLPVKGIITSIDVDRFGPQAFQ